MDDEDASQGYYVLTGVMTTLYYDYNGNTVNSAGYIIDATTGIVYSGVSETRYYVDDKDNDVIDAGEDEVTGDGLWYVIRDEEGKITGFQEVGNTKNTLTPEEYAELYTTSTTA